MLGIINSLCAWASYEKTNIAFNLLSLKFLFPSTKHTGAQLSVILLNLLNFFTFSIQCPHHQFQWWVIYIKFPSSRYDFNAVYHINLHITAQLMVSHYNESKPWEFNLTDHDSIKCLKHSESYSQYMKRKKGCNSCFQPVEENSKMTKHKNFCL